MAQSVARQAVNLQVAGSNPAGGEFAIERSGQSRVRHTHIPSHHGQAEWRSGQRGGPITHRSWDRNPPLLICIAFALQRW